MQQSTRGKQSLESISMPQGFGKFFLLRLEFFKKYISIYLKNTAISVAVSVSIRFYFIRSVEVFIGFVYWRSWTSE
jgi:hypothetical protein